MSAITKAKISISLTGKQMSDSTKNKMSASRSGERNYYFGRSLPVTTLDAAAAVLGTPVYVYDKVTLTLVNGKPFRSIRETVKHLPISQATLPKKLDTGKPFKGYYYFTNPRQVRPSDHN